MRLQDLGKKVKIVTISRGVSAKSGKPYCRVLIKGKNKKGASVTRDIFVDEDVSQKMMEDGIEEEEEVVVYEKLSDNLRESFVAIEKDYEIAAGDFEIEE